MLTETRDLTVGDAIVSAAGSVFEITKLTRVGRGIRVHYVTEDGRSGKFSAAPDAVSRVRREPVATGQA
ncbi:hypothetical protein [Agromyces humi]|uniref:hypothetical protein n=1 Tax=Agromyces humi TaxID=1766800 RepID=UPI00135768CA|nr:hypothetical protein [Agromyces humi]